MKILIVDEGRERSSVAAARALAASGWTVGAASAQPNLASRSRSVSQWHQLPHTSDGVDEFVTRLDRIVTGDGYDLAVVGWDDAVQAVSKHRGQLSFPCGYGPHTGVMLAMDKQRLGEMALGAGLLVPETHAATADGLSDVRGPVVVKPVLQMNSVPAARVCRTPAEALNYAGLIEAQGGQAIAQAVIEGTLAAVSLVAGADGIVTYAQQIAELVWPQPAGITARGLTVPIDLGLRGRIERLLETLEWRGLAHLQFLVPADGEPRLIDFNTRYYGSMALAIRAGANHPDAWARVATGRPIVPRDGVAGARYQWFSRDVRASVAARDPRELVRSVTVGVQATHNLWSWQEPTLAPRFLAEQLGRRILPAETHQRSAGAGESDANALLHGVATPSAAVRRTLRNRRIPPLPGRVAQRIAMKAGRLSYEEQWLEPVQTARREVLGGQALGPPRFLVRVDEFPYYSGYDEPKFGWEASQRFHAVMAEAGVPHLMSVVSQWTHEPLRPDGQGGRPLDDRDVALLDQMRADGVTFAQHGRDHRTRYTDPRRQSELCGLEAGRLEELLSQGREQLAAAGVHPRIFVPPFNRFDASQWPILARHFDVVTGGPESVVQIGFHGGPLWRGEAVYLPCYAPLYESAAAVLPAVDALIEQQIATWIPVVLHMGWEIDDNYAALRRLAQRIAPFAASFDDFLDDVDRTRPA